MPMTQMDKFLYIFIYFTEPLKGRVCFVLSVFFTVSGAHSQLSHARYHTPQEVSGAHQFVSSAVKILIL